MIFELCSCSTRAQVPDGAATGSTVAPVKPALGGGLEPQKAVSASLPPITPIEGAVSRHFVDVTDYGAETWNPGSNIDDTSAIQAAIDAVCAEVQSSWGRTIPVLFFPPGAYPISQPQLPSTSSPLNIPCSFEMEGSGISGGAQFSPMAHGSWILVNPGPNPNEAAAMTFVYPQRPVIRNLTIEGYNQAVAIYGGAPSVFEDVCLTTPVTGMLDNAPLKVTDAFWVWYKGGCLQTSSPDAPVALFTADDMGDYPRLTNLIFFSDLITAGGGFKYIQRAPLNAAVPGVMVFRNITMETAPDVLEISQTCTGCANWEFSNVTFDTVEVADSACVACSVINMNAPDGILSGVIIRNSFAGNQGLGRAITMNAGRLDTHQINSCLTYCVSKVVDANGDPIWNYTGQVALSGGTKTLTFSPVIFPFNPPICIPNDESTINGAKITTTTTTMTISGGPSDVVDYACYDNPKY